MTDAAPGPGAGDWDSGDVRYAWGEVIDPTGLPELFKGELAPDEHVRFRVPAPGIDNMHLRSVDTFSIPGRGLFTVPFAGYFQVIRGEPSSYDWSDARMVVNYTGLKLFGRHEELGPITVELNPTILSGGEIYRTSASEPQKYRIAVGAFFHLHQMGATFFNKEPILLKNPDMKGIPPVGEGGPAAVWDLPLYDLANAHASPAAYLTDLQYTVLDYMTRKEALAYRAAPSEEEFRRIMGT